jgi:UDP-3-O-[3-hydroxymyristoyl] N-acetylglucosamine deacetylase/3-hydroxyacyl-[acyl-carrier-protein] dehydratase
LKSPVEVRGVGLHSGKDTKVVLKPAAAGEGIVFVRTDLPDAPEIAAVGENMTHRERRSCLRNGPAEVFTCEHLLATLSALRIDNVTIEIDGEEVPGMDGSAKEFVAAVRNAGVVEQNAERKTFAVKEPIYVREGTATLVALPGNGGFSVDYHLDFPARNGSGNHHQMVSLGVDADSFEREIAAARTFVFESEVEQLRAAGLGKGATPENTLVIDQSGEAKQNTLRYPDEIARHKILDLVGDLAMVGVDLDAHIVATRSGHSLNLKLVQRLLDEMHAAENTGEIERTSQLDVRAIMNLLPHRFPFLLIDRVIELEGFKRAVAIKNVSINEPYFQGHWPGQPIMPGVLQLEAMAQLAGVLLLRKLENTGKLAVLWSIDKVKLRGAVVPGDQLRIEVQTIRAKPSVGHVEARCKVGGKIVAEAELKFTLIDA